MDDKQKSWHYSAKFFPLIDQSFFSSFSVFFVENHFFPIYFLSLSKAHVAWAQYLDIAIKNYDHFEMHLELRTYLGQHKSMAKNCQIIVISFYCNIGCQNCSCDKGLTMSFIQHRFFSSSNALCFDITKKRYIKKVTESKFQLKGQCQPSLKYILRY